MPKSAALEPMPAAGAEVGTEGARTTARRVAGKVGGAPATPAQLTLPLAAAPTRPAHVAPATTPPAEPSATRRRARPTPALRADHSAESGSPRAEPRAEPHAEHSATAHPTAPDGAPAILRRHFGELRAALADGWEIVQPIFARPLWSVADDSATAFSFVLSGPHGTRLITVPQGRTVERFIRDRHLTVDYAH